MFSSKVKGKSYILTIQNNDDWTFLIFFVFTVVIPSELETRLHYLLIAIISDTHLHRWAVARHKTEFCNKGQFMKFEIR